MALNARAKNKTPEYSLFDVLYDDGSRTSNRKVPDSELTGSDREEAVKAYLEVQDRKLAETSGKYRGTITAVLPVAR